MIYENIINELKAKDSNTHQFDIFLDFFQHSPDIMIVLNGDHKIIECNKITTAKFALGKSEIIGKQLDQLFDDEEVIRNLLHCFKKFIETGYCENIEIKIKNRQGESLFFSINGTSIKNKEGQIIYSRLIWRDITEIKKIQLIQSVLYNISDAAQNNDLNIHSFCQVVHHQLKKVIEATNFYISIHNTQTDEVSFIYVVDAHIGEKHQAYQTRKFSNGLTELVIKQAKSLLIKENLEGHLKNNRIGRYYGKRAESWLGIPLRTKNEIFGVLAVQSYEFQNAYNQEDLQLLEFVSDQISRSIHWQRSQVELKKAYELNKRILETSDLIFYVVNVESHDDLMQNKLTYISPQAEQIFGIDSKRFLTDSTFWFNSIHPDDVALVQVETKKMLGSRDPVTRQYRVKNHKSGDYVWLEDTVVPAFSQTGEIKEIYGSARDITERKSWEKALTKSQNQYKNFINYSQEGIWRIEYPGPLNIDLPRNELARKILFEGHIAECNLRMAKMYGYQKPSGLIGKRMIDLFNPTSEEELEIAVQRAENFIKKGFVVNGTISREKNKKGKDIYLSNSTIAIINKKQEIEEMWGIQREVTNEVKAKEQIKQSLKELQMIDNVNSYSIGGLSIDNLAKITHEAFNKISPDLSVFRFFVFDEESENLNLIHENVAQSLHSTHKKNKLNLDALIHPFQRQSAFRETLKSGKFIITYAKNYNNQTALRKYDEKLIQYVRWVQWAQCLLEIQTLIVIPLVAEGEFLGLINLGYKKTLTPNQIKSIKRFTNGVMNALIKSQAEKKVESQRKFNETILNYLPAGIVVFDREYKYQYINQAWVKDQEFRKWLVGKTDYDYCERSGESKNLAIKREVAFNQAVESKSGIDWIDTQTDTDGEEKHVLRKIEPYYENERLEYLIGYGIDITEQKKLEKLLLNLTHIQKRFIIEGPEVNIFNELLAVFLKLTKSDSGFVALKDDEVEKNAYIIKSATNKYWQQNLRTIYNNFEDEQSNGIRVKWFSNQEKAYQSLHSLNKIDRKFELKGLPGKYKNDYVFLGIGFYSRNELRAVMGLMKFNGPYGQIDIDAINPFATTCATLFDAYYNQSKAAKVERLNRKLANIVSHSTDAIVSINNDRTVNSWNKGAETLFGYCSEEIIGQDISIIIPEDKLEESYKLASRTSKGEMISGFETIRINREGERIDVVFSLFPLNNENNEVIGISGIIRDNREKIRLDQMRLKSILEGEENERDRIAHDLHDGLGQILSALIINLQAVKLNIDSDVDNLIKIARQANEEYRAITQNLISPTLKGEGLIDSIKNICDTLCKGIGHKIRFKFSSINKLELSIEVLLYRCAQELINNAVKHSKSDSIEVSLTQLSNEVCLKVRDNGIGFDHKNKLTFKGFGLYSMKSRVQMYGGIFKLWSKKNVGTIAKIILDTSSTS
ncbi:PAS domain S-box protein [Fulvivirgaceae bacterium BMA10]|uniref:histidine kinase n=1 Tax=Splendidivirga corallicola TaxID=3051826 RepID=A0ABT8KUK9_9BACT|nr:PAS domain S-box protein [Fulvivirgaceae bacterium BMA10]